MKGRKIRMEEVPILAQPHAAGTVVRFVVPALHLTYGVIAVEMPLYWPFHHGEWQRAHELLVKADAELLRIPIESSQQRPLNNDTELQATLYLAGANVVLHAILATHFLASDIERSTGLEPNSETTLAIRVRRALQRIGFRNPVHEDGWAKFILLHQIRDAVSHPKPSNLYAQAEGSWAQVPLAWFASGHAIEASAAYRKLFEEIAEHWQATRKDFAKSATLSGLKRGLRSAHQVKNPPMGTVEIDPAAQVGAVPRSESTGED